MKKYLIVILLLILLITALFFTGCDFFNKDSDNDISDETNDIVEDPEPTPFPLIIGDVIIAESPKRVVSLSPSLTEIIFELGYGNRIVGKSNFCDYPPSVLSIAEAGSGANPDIDRIISLTPDLLVTATPLSARDMFRMEQENIAILTVPASTNLTLLGDTYRLLGLVFGGLFTGAEAGEEAFSVIARVCNNTAVIDIGRFIYVTSGLKAATGDTLEDSVFSCFGENIAKSYTDYDFDFSVLLDNQPDIILLSDRYSAEDLTVSEDFKELEAVEAGRIIYIDNTFFERPSARLVKIIEGMLDDFKYV